MTKLTNVVRVQRETLIQVWGKQWVIEHNEVTYYFQTKHEAVKFALNLVSL